MTAQPETIQNQIDELKGKVEERIRKMDDVKHRIDRQEEHIKKTKNKKARFESHLDRWSYQNERDLKKIKELEEGLEDSDAVQP